MMSKKITTGVHTYSVGMNLTYEQYKKVKIAVRNSGKIEDSSNVFKNKERIYCSALDHSGLKIFLNAKRGKCYLLRIQIEPCRVLGEPDPTQLWKYSKGGYKRICKTADKLLKPFHIPLSIDQMKISRCDLTVNLEFENQQFVYAYLRILKKGRTMPCYRPVEFKPKDHKARDSKAANEHSCCFSCKSASFLVYDKIAQLEMIGRCSAAIQNRSILRLEAELKRTALKQRLGKTALQNNRKLLRTAGEQVPKVISWYLNRILPSCQRYVRYEDTIELVKKASGHQAMRERMLYLLRKTSDSNNLDRALDKLRKKYDLKEGQVNRVLKKFQKLGISPITLQNRSESNTLPSILSILD